MKKKQPRTKSPASKATNQPNPRPVPLHEQQYAQVGSAILDVEQAFRLLRKVRRRTVPIDVGSWARFYGMDGNPFSPVRLGPLFDRTHAMSTNLGRPLILATVATGSTIDEDSLLIIDGSHRLYRAFVEGHDQLPGLILTEAETAAIAVTGPFA